MAHNMKAVSIGLIAAVATYLITPSLPGWVKAATIFVLAPLTIWNIWKARP